VEDFDRQILPALSEYLLELLAHHLTSAMMGVDDAVADFEFNRLQGLDRLQLLRVLFK
jgi:hypothetical protein